MGLQKEKEAYTLLKLMRGTDSRKQDMDGDGILPTSLACPVRPGRSPFHIPSTPLFFVSALTVIHMSGIHSFPVAIHPLRREMLCDQQRTKESHHY
jgi:hypothetical protein